MPFNFEEVSQSTTTYSKPQSMPNGSVQPEAASSVNFTNHESIKSLNKEDNNLSNTKKSLPVDLFLKALKGLKGRTPKVCIHILLV